MDIHRLEQLKKDSRTVIEENRTWSEYANGDILFHDLSLKVMMVDRLDRIALALELIAEHMEG
jgi:hypothetical protein